MSVTAVRSSFAFALALAIAASGCGEDRDRSGALDSYEELLETEAPGVAEPVPEPAAPEEEDPAAKAAREEAIKAAIVKAERIQLGTKAELKPSANNCLWGLNNEDPQKALEVAECMNRSEVFNDLRTCIEPCRPPDPSLAR